MSSIFRKYFTRQINEELDGELDTQMDKTAFEGSFNDQDELGRVENEVVQATPDVEDNARIVKKANMYSKKITSIILPILRQLDTDLLSGDLSRVAPDIKGISDIRQDLAKLAEALTGETNEAIRQKLKDQANQ